MAVLAANKQRPFRLAHGSLATKELPLAGYTNFAGGSAEHTVFNGSLVVCDVSDTDGYFRAVPLTSSTNMAGGDVFGGVAIEKQKVLAADTGDGSVVCSVARNGVWGFAKGSVAQTDIGAAAYASDDDTIVTATTNNLWVGYIEEVDDRIVRAFGFAYSALERRLRRYSKKKTNLERRDRSRIKNIMGSVGGAVGKVGGTVGRIVPRRRKRDRR